MSINSIKDPQHGSSSSGIDSPTVHPTMMESQQTGSSSRNDGSMEPLLPPFQQVFSREYLNRLAMGPAGLGYGLAYSCWCIVYWATQFFLVAVALLAAVLVPAHNEDGARVKASTIAGILALETVLLLMRSCHKQRQKPELPFRYCFAHCLFEHALVAIWYLGIYLVYRCQLKVTGEQQYDPSSDDHYEKQQPPTWKHFAFLYGLVLVSHVGLFFNVSYAWVGSQQLQDVQFPPVFQTTSVLLHALFMLELWRGVLELMGLAFHMPFLWACLLVPIHYGLCMVSLYIFVAQNLIASGKPPFQRNARTGLLAVSPVETQSSFG